MFTPLTIAASEMLRIVGMEQQGWGAGAMKAGNQYSWLSAHPVGRILNRIGHLHQRISSLKVVSGEVWTFGPQVS